MIDQTASADEIKAFNEYLARHPEAVEIYAAQQKISDMLAAIPQFDPPPYLQGKIMAALPPSSRPGRVSWLQAISSWLAPPQWRFAFSLVAGIIVGICAFILFFSIKNLDNLSEDSLIGTALFSTPMQTQRIEHTPIKADIAWHSEPQRLVVKLALEAAEPVTVEFTFNANDLYLNQFYQSAGHLAHPVTFEPGSIKIDTVEENRYFLVFSSRGSVGATVQMSIYYKGELMFTRPFYSLPPD